MAKVLIVDDERSIRITLQEFLKDIGHTVYTSENAISAIELLKKESVDVLITDVILPEVSGVELLKTVKEIDPDIPVIMMTGQPTLDAAVQSIRQSAFDFLRKPVTQDAIVKAVLSASNMKRLADERKKIEEERERYKCQLESMVRERTGELRAVNTKLKAQIKRMEEQRYALKRSEEKFHKLLQTATDAIICFDQNGKIVMWNNASEKLFGYTKFKALGMPLQRILSMKEYGDDFTSFLNATFYFEDKNSAGKQQNGIGISQSGENIPVELSVSGIQEGHIWLYTTIIRDIRLRIKAENEIHKFKSIADNALFGSAISDFEGNLTYINSFFAKQHGYTPEELLHKNLSILHTEKQMAVVRKTIEELKENGSFEGREIWHVHKNGDEFPMLMSGVLIQSANGGPNHLAVTAMTLTKYKELEKSLLQSQKLESIGKLAGGVAHDFNNLLTVMNGYAELGLMKLKEGHPAYSDVLSIQETTKRAEHLTRQLLAFSRKQVIQPEIVDLNDIINGVDKMLRRLIGEDIHLKTSLSTEPLFIKADPGQIEQILMNLVVNARDAVDDNKNGKEILILTGAEEASAFVNTDHGGIVEGHYVFFRVSDNGIGMNEETRARIFDPFYTTKAEGEGTGLGLATVYGIVQQNKAFINVKSEVGKGSTFTILWSKEESEPVKKIVVPKAEYKRAEGTLLVVEDDDAVRNLICNALKKFGYNVHEAKDGQQALEMMQDNHFRKQINLLITDLVMPKLGGIEFTQKIRKYNPDLKIIFTSGYARKESLNRVERNDSIIFLQKPFSVSALANKIEKIFS